MTDALPDWDRDPPRTAAIDARVRDLRLRYRLGTDDFLPTMLHLYADCLEDGCLPEAILALLKADKTDLDGAQAPSLSLARQAQDLSLARERALEEMQ